MFYQLRGNMQVLIFGAPGVGKGTQAKMISELKKLKHISTGDILRENIQNQTPLGIEVKGIMDRGDLVPDELMGRLVKDSLSKHKDAFILDGYPRTKFQIEIMDNIFKDLDITDPYVVILDADDEIIVKRLSSRRSCTNCGYIISLLTQKENDPCPKCGNCCEFIKRNDDDEKVIAKRLSVYHETTEPVVEYYRKMAHAITIDATLTPDEVNNILLEKLV